VCASAVVIVVMLDTPCSDVERKTTGCPLHSHVFPSLPVPCVIVCHQVSTELCYVLYAYILIVWHFEVPLDVSNCLVNLSQEKPAVCSPILYLFHSCVLKQVLPVSCEMAFKIFDKHLVYPISCRWITTCITHRASSTIQVLPHYHRNLPNTLKIIAE